MKHIDNITQFVSDEFYKAVDAKKYLAWLPQAGKCVRCWQTTVQFFHNSNCNIAQKVLVLQLIQFFALRESIRCIDKTDIVGPHKTISI